MTRITVRPVPQRARLMLEQAGIHPLLARLYAARGIQNSAELDTELKSLLPFDSLKGIDRAAEILADAIADRQSILIVADYDCDGATACAVGLRALRSFGAQVDYLVPNRFKTGYGLSPEVVQIASQRKPDILVTVDNGIGSVTGVAAAKALGMRVVITDHHLPGAELPRADAIVNPNQPGCRFLSKSIAGVGVMFYVMLATRSELRRRGLFADRPEPNLAALLDLVALGTIADVVILDRNNRTLVAQGLKRIRQRKFQPGIAALLQISRREPERAASFDLGFAVGPRLNAAGRLADMSLGIECLATDDMGRALNIAQQLDQINQDRRAIEADMQEAAAVLLENFDPGERASLCLFDPAWHQGVIGILAGRLKDKWHRPTIVFARGSNGELKGSGRSIHELHLRDTLDRIDKQHPGLLKRFGGHAAAAGLTIEESSLELFKTGFEYFCGELILPSELAKTIETDGSLEAGYLNLTPARLLDDAVWGQGFPSPIFADEFEVIQQRLLQEKHLKLTVRKDRQTFDAIRFNHAESAPDRIYAAYRLDRNTWRGEEKLQLVLEHFTAA